MRERFTSLLVCGCDEETKAAVEQRAALVGFSQADFVRIAVKEKLARKEAADAA